LSVPACIQGLLFYLKRLKGYAEIFLVLHNIMSFSPTQKTLAILPKFTGFLSLMGSLFIFQDVVIHKRPISRVYYRIMLGLSCSDMIASTVNIFSTWPIPPDSGNFLASGTTATCTAQGFFNELGNLATPLYNASLCAYYVLIIRQAWSEDRIRVRAEPFMHAIPILIALTIAILGLPFTLYNNSGWLCWIAKYPKGCSGSECTRGVHADIFRWVHYAIIWSAIIGVTVGMYLIYLKVKSFDRREAEENNEEVARMERSKKVAIQSALFVGALYLTWSFTTVTRIYQVTTGNNSTTLLVLMAIFFPLQGFFNFLVYCRPRYLRCKSRNPNLSTRKLLWLALQPEDHTKRRGQPATREGQTPYVGREESDQRSSRDRRSITQSYYSVDNNFAKYPHNTGDDYTAINTVKAVADENDYRLPDKEKSDRAGKSDDASDADDVTKETRLKSVTEGAKVELDENSDAPDHDEEDQRAGAEHEDGGAAKEESNVQQPENNAANPENQGEEQMHDAGAST